MTLRLTGSRAISYELPFPSFLSAYITTHQILAWALIPQHHGEKISELRVPSNPTEIAHLRLTFTRRLARGVGEMKESNRSTSRECHLDCKAGLELKVSTKTYRREIRPEAGWDGDEDHCVFPRS